MRGARIVQASWAGTLIYVAAAVAAVVSLAFEQAVVVVSLALFAVGVVAFLAAYFRAIGRSRYEAIGMGGLFFGSRSAPRRVQRLLVAPFVIQVVVALATSWMRMYTGVAFGILVPMYGLGMIGLWISRYGTFPPREQERATGPDADGSKGDGKGDGEG